MKKWIRDIKQEAKSCLAADATILPSRVKRIVWYTVSVVGAILFVVGFIGADKASPSTSLIILGLLAALYPGIAFLDKAERWIAAEQQRDKSREVSK